MADMMTYAKSNKFRVKDIKSFLKWAGSLDLTVLHKTNTGVHYVVIYPPWPECGWCGRSDITEEEFEKELVTHLDERDIVILQTISHMKLCDIYGRTVALAADGSRWCVDLDDIYSLVSHDANEMNMEHL